MVYDIKSKVRAKHSHKFWLIVLAVVTVLVVGGTWTLHTWYTRNLRPLSSSHSTIYFTVSEGDSKHQIAVNLQRAHLIRNSQAFETYVRGNEIQVLQAGTYAFSQSMSVQQIVHDMVVGNVAKNLLTILPGKPIAQIKQAFIKSGYSQATVDEAFTPAHYTGHPALASLPKGASLEGYLYPDSFQKLSNTPADLIVRESLDEMQKHLSSDVMNGFVAQGLNIYQGITLASIVEQETSDPADQPVVAQVFLSRIRQGMMLQSDVTAFYGADISGQARSVNVDSPYNTYLHAGLPPGPISNVGADALQAVAHPANTDYLYFVTGDDGVMHFSHTQQEHQAAVNQFCTKQCSH